MSLTYVVYRGMGKVETITSSEFRKWSKCISTANITTKAGRGVLLRGALEEQGRKSDEFKRLPRLVLDTFRNLYKMQFSL